MVSQVISSQEDAETQAKEGAVDALATDSAGCSSVSQGNTARQRPGGEKKQRGKTRPTPFQENMAKLDALHNSISSMKPERTDVEYLDEKRVAQQRQAREDREKLLNLPMVCAHPNCRCNVSHAWFLNYPLQEPEELAKLPGTMKALGMAEAMLAEDEARRNFR